MKYSKKDICSIVISILPLVLSVTFMASSLMKAVNIRAFANETLLYSETYLSSTLSPYSTEIACAVCSAELMLAMLFLRQRCILFASCLSFAMLSFFVVLTGLNVFFPTSFGRIESCGCFGEMLHISPLEAFVKSVVL